MIFLEMAELSEKCFLLEALMWRCVGRLPVYNYNGHPFDGDRFDEDLVDGDRPNVEFDGYSEAELWSCEITPSKEYLRILDEGGPYRVDEQLYERLLKLFSDDESEAQRIRDRRDVLRKENQVWTETCQQMLQRTQIAQSEIFLKLVSGSIRAFGRRYGVCNHNKENKFCSFGCFSESDKFDPLKIEEIPRDFWILDKIDWEGSSAVGHNDRFVLIHLLSEEVISVLPYDTTGKSEISAIICGDYFIVSDIPGSAENIGPRRRGRPTLPWEKFLIEFTRRAVERSLPSKKEAAIAEASAWCQQNWGKSPGRTSIQAKLSEIEKLVVPKINAKK